VGGCARHPWIVDALRDSGTLFEQFGRPVEIAGVALELTQAVEGMGDVNL